MKRKHAHCNSVIAVIAFLGCGVGLGFPENLSPGWLSATSRAGLSTDGDTYSVAANPAAMGEMGIWFDLNGAKPLDFEGVSNWNTSVHAEGNNWGVGVQYGREDWLQLWREEQGSLETHLVFRKSNPTENPFVIFGTRMLFSQQGDIGSRSLQTWRHQDGVDGHYGRLNLGGFVQWKSKPHQEHHDFDWSHGLHDFEVELGSLGWAWTFMESSQAHRGFDLALKSWGDLVWMPNQGVHPRLGLEAQSLQRFCFRFGLSQAPFKMAMGVRLTWKNWTLFDASTFEREWGKIVTVGLRLPLSHPKQG